MVSLEKKIKIIYFICVPFDELIMNIYTKIKSLDQIILLNTCNILIRADRVQNNAATNACTCMSIV